MPAEKNQVEAAPTKEITSCWKKKKSESKNFMQDVKDHIDVFIHASKHKTCFQQKFKKLFSMSKVVADRNSGAAEIKSSSD